MSLRGILDLVEVIERKVRRAVETNQAFVSVRDIRAGAGGSVPRWHSLSSKRYIMHVIFHRN